MRTYLSAAGGLAIRSSRLELEGPVMFGEARRKEFTLGTLFQSGKPQRALFPLSCRHPNGITELPRDALDQRVHSRKE
jgi:hypothetical protein